MHRPHRLGGQLGPGQQVNRRVTGDAIDLEKQQASNPLVEILKTDNVPGEDYLEAVNIKPVKVII